MTGHLNFPSEMVSVDSINYGNSILSFWPEAPHKTSGGVISFSGVTPGGYAATSKGLLFSVVFKSLKEGSVDLSLSDYMALKNDGEGSKVSLSSGTSSIVVTPVSSSITTSAGTDASKNLSQEAIVAKDGEAPETFIPLVGDHQDIFDSKYFIVFSTTDKISGIDHYEIQESVWNYAAPSSWVKAESPYLLRDQKLHSYVFVKAFDRAGNTRMETLYPLYPQKFYQSIAFWVIIILVTFFVVFFFKKKLRSEICPTNNENQNRS